MLVWKTILPMTTDKQVARFRVNCIVEVAVAVFSWLTFAWSARRGGRNSNPVPRPAMI